MSRLSWDFYNKNPDWIIIKESRSWWNHMYWIYGPKSNVHKGLAWTLWGAKRILRKRKNNISETRETVVYRESE